MGSPDESFYDEEEDPEDEMLKHPFSDFVVDPTGDLYYAWQVSGTGYLDSFIII